MYGEDRRSPGDRVTPPLITIGLPVYNGGRYLRACLDSLLAQTFTDFEVLLSDNDSIDDTGEVGQQYARKDPRIRYEKLPANLGAIYNFNKTLRAARSLYFKWQAADDVLDPRFLEVTLDCLQGPQNALLASTRVVFIDEEGRRLWEHGQRVNVAQGSPADRLLHLLTEIDLGSPSYGLTFTEALRRTGGLRDHPSSDLCLLASLALQGPLLEVPEPLFYRRLHRGQSRRGSAHKLARWHGRTKPFRFEHWRVLGGMVKAIVNANLALDETIRSFWALGCWTKRYRGGLVRDLRM